MPSASDTAGAAGGLIPRGSAWHAACSRSNGMEPIDPTATPDLASLDPESLALVNGGFGALLGALLQAAPGILQGVGSIISAARSGSSGGAPGPDPTQAQPQPAPSAAPPAASAAPAAPQDASVSAGAVPRVLVIRFG